MVVRQFMLPSDSLSNMVSLLSLVTHVQQDVNAEDTLEMNSHSNKCDKNWSMFQQTPTHA